MIKVGDRVHVDTIGKNGEVVSIDGDWVQVFVDDETMEDWFLITELSKER